jgi:hypothetical protein
MNQQDGHTYLCSGSAGADSIYIKVALLLRNPKRLIDEAGSEEERRALRCNGTEVREDLGRDHSRHARIDCSRLQSDRRSK